MLGKLGIYWRIWRTFRDYKPLRPTIPGFRRWLEQYAEVDRPWLTKLLEHVVYLDERTIRNSLVQQNAALLAKLAADGVDSAHVVYVQYHDPASSSGAMLNMLRDAANLEHKRCRFVDGRNAIDVQRVLDELGQGAIVYVDDFVGTGNQFCRERDAMSRSFVGVFPEFLLVPVICEEALDKLITRGIRWQTHLIHSKSQRPLHLESFAFPVPVRDRLRAIALQQHPSQGLGYKQTASMVVLYRNAPNTVPLLLRGDLGQHPKTGLFPRFQDFPKEGAAPLA